LATIAELVADFMRADDVMAWVKSHTAEELLAVSAALLAVVHQMTPPT
jgi:hypothetical protein